VRRPLDLCVRFSLLIAILATFFLHPHAMAFAILCTLDLDPHMRNLLVDARGDTLDASGLSERDAGAMLREMCGAPRGALQATAGDHHRDGAFLDQVVRC
jgi:hypothetical protein